MRCVGRGSAEESEQETLFCFFGERGLRLGAPCPGPNVFRYLDAPKRHTSDLHSIHVYLRDHRKDHAAKRWMKDAKALRLSISVPKSVPNRRSSGGLCRGSHESWGVGGVVGLGELTLLGSSRRWEIWICSR